MSQARARNRRKYVRYHMDALETRTLMSITVSPIDDPTRYAVAAYRNPADNHLWIVNVAGSMRLTDTDGTANFDLSTLQFNFNNGFVITGGHAYLSDVRGGIDDINLNDTNGAVNYISLAGSTDQTPVELVVTPNAVWFTCTGFLAVDNLSSTNYVGRWVPGNNPADFLPLNGTLNDSAALSISANGADGVWVGMDGLDNAAFPGKNHLVKVSYTGGSFSSSTVAVNSSDPVADVNNHVLSVASDGTGGVWYTLSNEAAFGSARTASGAETIVHLASNNTQTPFQVTTDPNALLKVSNLTLGPGHRLWFDEIFGNEAGYLDTMTGQFDTKPYLTEAVQSSDIIVNPAANEAIILTATSLMQLYQVDAPTITFNGTASDLTTPADTPISLSASFTASAPAGGTYSASISWGDNTFTTTGITVTPGTGNTYTISYTGKTFSTPGTYGGLITVSDLGNGGGTIGFTTTVSALFVGSATNISGDEDTPLSLSANFTASAPAGGSYLATVHWGDGSPDSAATVTSLGNDHYTISYSGKVFANPGNYTNGTITVHDAAQGGGVISFSSSISAIVFSGASSGISGAEDVAQTLAGMFTAALPASGQYTATINWGNSTPASTGTVMSLGGNGYAVVYQGKIFSVQGTFNGSIVIKDGNITAGTILFNSVITDMPLVVSPPTLVNTNGKFFNLSANFSDDIDSTTSWFTATVTWGDGSTSAGVVVADTAHPGHYVVLATHKYKKGTFNVAVTVTSNDEANLATSVVATTSLTVS